MAVKKPCASLAVAALAATLAGCAQLLPKSSSEVTSPWGSYEAAKAAIERLVPERTTTAELHGLGLDPYLNPNVQILTYSDIVLRFPLGGAVAPERLDAGLRRCLEAGKACSGYSVTAKDIRRERVGTYLVDALGFKREVHINGWSFNALILLVDDRVVYTLHGGQPKVSEHEVSRQPLGPVQEWGNSVPMVPLSR
jgi:hypothetical protein